MSILTGISVLLALLLVKTRASGTRNGLLEANLNTACITLSALPAYMPYRKKYRTGNKTQDPNIKEEAHQRRITRVSEMCEEH